MLVLVVHEGGTLLLVFVDVGSGDGVVGLFYAVDRVVE